MDPLKFNSQELFDYLKANGCKEHECNDKTLDGNCVVFLAPNDVLITVQITAAYFPRHVRNVCDDAGIPLPDQFQKYYDQLGNMPK